MDGFHRLQRRIGDFQEILKRVTESYRRIRNTLSFLLANLSDSRPSSMRCRKTKWWKSHRYAMILARQLQERLAGDLCPRTPFTLP